MLTAKSDEISWCEGIRFVVERQVNLAGEKVEYDIGAGMLMCRDLLIGF